MKRIFAAAVMALCLAPAPAQANERMGGVAAGALAGALVLGPVGAIVGAAAGYAAGSAIAHRNAAPAEPRASAAMPNRQAARQSPGPARKSRGGEAGRHGETRGSAGLRRADPAAGPCAASRAAGQRHRRGGAALTMPERCGCAARSRHVNALSHRPRTL